LLPALPHLLVGLAYDLPALGNGIPGAESNS
jgi:hypothetical protein